jgi:hypothetical protein
MAAIYRLAPIDFGDPSWETTAYKGDCIVRAKSEDEARALAEKAFRSSAAEPSLGQLGRPTPWTNPALVRAEILKQSPFPPDGEDELLVP